MAAVLAYLRKVDPEAARRAQHRYACFDHFGADTQAYGYATSLGLAPSCETAVVAQLVELRRAAADYARRDGRVAADDLFFAEQNARLVANAEQYYRTMFAGRAESWNLRDRHMAETLEALVAAPLRFRPTRPRSWSGRTTPTSATRAPRRWATAGELNVGQLVRERYGAAGGAGRLHHATPAR